MTTAEKYDEMMFDVEAVWGTYINDLMIKYAMRKDLRKFKIGCPTLVFLGHSRCGKDTCVSELAKLTTLVPATSVSAAMAPLLAWSLDKPTPLAFEERHNDREYWYEWINAFRRKYRPDTPTRMALAYGDMVAGIRSKDELEACVKNDVTNVLVWVDRAVAPDPTLEFTYEDVLRLNRETGSAAVFVDNNGSLDDLKNEMAKLVANYQLPRSLTT